MLVILGPRGELCWQNRLGSVVWLAWQDGLSCQGRIDQLVGGVAIGWVGIVA